MSEALTWGILGAGTIARTFARGVARTSSRVLAVASRSQDRADQFGDEMNIPRRYGSYEALLADPEIEAVYIATPHPEHSEWAIRSAEAKKHILCEKPIGLNLGEAMAIVEAARDHDVFLMEAFMYRCHPQITRVLELIRDNAIGQVKMIQAAFGFRMEFDPAHRLWANELGGGGILDVGCYPVSIARLIAGAAIGKDFADPISVTGAAKLHEATGVDEYAVGSMAFPSGVVASVSTGVGLEQENVVRIYGTEGWILLPDPWIPSRNAEPAKIVLNKPGQPPVEIEIQPPNTLYALEAEMVARHINRRQAPSPAMSWEDTLGNMRTLDAWRRAVGLTYEAEKPMKLPTVHRRPLAKQPGHRMAFGRIPGVAIPVSRLVLGVDSDSALPVTAALWDDYFERGGNCFDTAHIYHGGYCERALGNWLRTRGVRQQVVLLDKGGHTPDCFPGPISRNHRESLSRLQTDYVDLYMLHRDNPDVPVGEFVDVLNEHLAAGTIRAIGLSNWSLARIIEFNDYARKNGKVGASAISNQFSLAKMITPPWAGCLGVDDEMAAWLRQTQTPLMPWSSQARGFFLPTTHQENRANEELVRCWFSDANFARLERAREMAKIKNVEPITLALAYVLRQPFPTFPLIGPRTIHEWRVSEQALDIELSVDELRAMES